MDWSHYFGEVQGLVERLRTLKDKDLVSNELESLGMLCSARISRPDREVLLLKKRLVAKPPFLNLQERPTESLANHGEISSSFMMRILNRMELTKSSFLFSLAH